MLKSKTRCSAPGVIDKLMQGLGVELDDVQRASDAALQKNQ
jgi:hypothetical protein